MSAASTVGSRLRTGFGWGKSTMSGSTVRPGSGETGEAMECGDETGKKEVDAASSERERGRVVEVGEVMSGVSSCLAVGGRTK